jgi:hypothetical protein
MSESYDCFRDRLPNAVCMGDKHSCCARCVNSKSEEERRALIMGREIPDGNYPLTTLKTNRTLQRKIICYTINAPGGFSIYGSSVPTGNHREPRTTHFYDS